MRRKIEYAPSYLRKAKKIGKANPRLKVLYTETLNRLSENPFNPLLHTHALTGDMKGKYACSLTYELRVIFKLYDDIVHLLDIGSHDEVY
jgi:addiction module RelE/StbE family toxin